MNRLKKIIEDTDTTSGRRFDLFIQLLIILSLISFTVETLPNLADSLRYALYLAEIVTVLIFTSEAVSVQRNSPAFPDRIHQGEIRTDTFCDCSTFPALFIQRRYLLL